MIIMVGSPGSGKSHFASNKLGCHGRMKIVSRDTLGTWQKCVDKAREYLTKSNGSVVIDNLNPDVESRKRFIEVAKSLNIPCRVFLMNVSKEHAKHNNKVNICIFKYFIGYICRNCFLTCCEIYVMVVELHPRLPRSYNQIYLYFCLKIFNEINALPIILFSI